MTKTEAYNKWLEEINAETDTNCAIDAGQYHVNGCYFIRYFGGEKDGRLFEFPYDRRTKLK